MQIIDHTINVSKASDADAAVAKISVRLKRQGVDAKVTRSGMRYLGLSRGWAVKIRAEIQDAPLPGYSFANPQVAAKLNIF